MVHKGEKRAMEGKDTEFSYAGVPVTAQRVENFKRRKITPAETNAGTIILVCHRRSYNMNMINLFLLSDSAEC